MMLLLFLLLFAVPPPRQGWNFVVRGEFRRQGLNFVVRVGISSSGGEFRRLGLNFVTRGEFRRQGEFRLQISSSPLPRSRGPDSGYNLHTHTYTNIYPKTKNR